MAKVEKNWRRLLEQLPINSKDSKKITSRSKMCNQSKPVHSVSSLFYFVLCIAFSLYIHKFVRVCIKHRYSWLVLHVNIYILILFPLRYDKSGFVKMGTTYENAHFSHILFYCCNLYKYLRRSVQ